MRDFYCVAKYNMFYSVIMTFAYESDDPFQTCLLCVIPQLFIILTYHIEVTDPAMYGH